MAASRFSIEAVVSMIDRVSNPMGKASASVAGFSATSQKHFANVGRSSGLMGGIIRKALPFVSIYSVGRGFKYLVDEASKIEDVTAAFTPLMGSVGKAQELVARLNKEAATTPYQFEQISGVAKQLLPVMNGDINKVAETFRMLGDTAGGNAQKLESITRGFTKAMLKGKVDLESLNMIGEAGVPIFDQLSKHLGVSSAQMFKMVTAGKVTTTQLTDTFKTMTSKGGIFFNGMELASQTLSGKISTLKDNIALTAAGIGQALLPTIKMVIDKIMGATGAVLEWVTANQELIGKSIKSFIDVMGTAINIIVTGIKWLYKFRNIILIVAIAYGVWKLAIIALMATQKVMMAVGFIKYILMMRSVIIKAITMTKLWAFAQKILNIILTANPIGLIIVGIAALIAYITIAIKYYDKFGAAMLFILGPIGQLISIFKTVYDRWDEIKSAFETKGMIEGFKKLGQVILDGVLYPIQQLLQLLSKIPGVGKYIGSAADKIKGLREGALGAKPVEDKLAKGIEKVQGKNITKEIIKGNANQDNKYIIPKNEKQLQGFASPESVKIITESRTKTTTKGGIDINVTGQKNAATVNQWGILPPGTKLNNGLQP